MSIHIVPFHPELLDQAAQLLAQRHRRDRVVLPDLPSRFEDASIARKSIETALQRKHASAVAALTTQMRESKWCAS